MRVQTKIRMGSKTVTPSLVAARMLKKQLSFAYRTSWAILRPIRFAVFQAMFAVAASCGHTGLAEAVERDSPKYALFSKFVIPTDVKPFVTWCGDAGKVLALFGKKSLYILDDANDKNSHIITIPVGVAINHRSFSCTDDGKSAFFLDTNGQALFAMNIADHLVTKILEISTGSFATPWPHIVSGDGEFIIGTPGFPDVIKLPDGRVLHVVKGLVPQRRSNQPSSIEWSHDPQRALLFFPSGAKLVVYDPKIDATTTRSLQSPSGATQLLFVSLNPVVALVEGLDSD